MELPYLPIPEDTYCNLQKKYSSDVVTLASCFEKHESTKYSWLCEMTKKTRFDYRKMSKYLKVYLYKSLSYMIQKMVHSQGRSP